MYKKWESGLNSNVIMFDLDFLRRHKLFLDILSGSSYTFYTDKEFILCLSDIVIK